MECHEEAESAGEKAASILLKLFINGNEKCLTSKDCERMNGT